MIRSRAAALFLTFIMLFTVCTVRIFYLSSDLVYEDAAQAAQNQSRVKITAAERRGFIFDRHGKPIAGIPAGYITYIDSGEINSQNYDEVFCEISGACESITPDEINNIEISMHSGRMFRIHTRRPLDTHCAFSFPDYARYGETAPHIAGYLDADGRGVCGIERAYNGLLEDLSGHAVIEYRVSGDGRVLGGYPVIVNDYSYWEQSGLALTLDAGLQQYVQGLEIKKGAVMAADADSGEILCCASFPSYDRENVAEYLDSENGELINRCACAFTPGSVFKVVTAAAALEYSGSLGSLEFYCGGSRCYNNTAHGKVDMKKALAQSCNEYFVNLAGITGTGRIKNMSDRLGIGKNMTVDRINFGCGNFDGSIQANAAIGQGGTLMTPAEVTRVMCAAANGGYLVGLRLADRIVMPGGRENIINDYGKTGEKERVFSSMTAGRLRGLLINVVDNGIGSPARGDIPDEFEVGGKTASAQSGQFEPDEDGDGIKELVHSWFSGFVSDKKKTVVITVLLEGGGSGAGGIFEKTAEKIIETGYFGQAPCRRGGTSVMCTNNTNNAVR